MSHSFESFPLILLAGGRSSRMGVPKGLLQYQGRFWMIEQFNRFKVAGGKRVMVVLGFHRKQYLEKMPWLAGEFQTPVLLMSLQLSVAINPHPQLGPFSSLQCAIAALKKEEEDYLGAFILPIDVPGPGPEVFQEMTRAFENSWEALIPRFRSNGGHPVLLSRNFINRLAEVSPKSMDARLDFQIRALPRNKIAYLPVADERVCLNLNDPAEFQRYTEGKG
jgi:CTP:molybdopterin cytidylyltransferase MocA